MSSTHGERPSFLYPLPSPKSHSNERCHSYEHEYSSPMTHRNFLSWSSSFLFHTLRYICGTLKAYSCTLFQSKGNLVIVGMGLLWNHFWGTLQLRYPCCHSWALSSKTAMALVYLKPHICYPSITPSKQHTCRCSLYLKEVADCLICLACSAIHAPCELTPPHLLVIIKILSIQVQKNRHFDALYSFKWKGELKFDCVCFCIPCYHILEFYCLWFVLLI